MNWLERARREIGKSVHRPAANSAERNPTAAMAVLQPILRKKLGASIGSSDSAQSALMLENESVRNEFEERAAIMEFDGGLSREGAECAAWALVLTRHWLH